MAYVPTEWKTDDIITADLMNKMEIGIKAVEDGMPVVPSPPVLATDSTDGLLAKGDFAKLAKITGATTVTDLATDSDAPAIVTAVNEINAILVANGLATASGAKKSKK